MKVRFECLLIVFLMSLCLTFSAFSADSSSSISPKPKWKVGKWVRIGSDINYSSELNITSVTGDTFQFEISANYGANIGSIDGKAKINGNTAVFNDSCKLTFSLDSKTLVIKIDGDCYGGLNVNYNGEYRKTKN